MNERPRTEDNADTSRRSAWTALDEAFFRLVQDAFSHGFCAGASCLLAANDDLVPERPEVVTPPKQVDDLRQELTARAAAMRRHPRDRPRF
jgi:hypothetical protein